jgi:hypothetical protein
MGHYYDIYCLRKQPEIRKFITTNEYKNIRREGFEKEIIPLSPKTRHSFFKRSK